MGSWLVGSKNNVQKPFFYFWLSRVYISSLMKKNYTWDTKFPMQKATKLVVRFCLKVVHDFFTGCPLFHTSCLPRTSRSAHKTLHMNMENIRTAFHRPALVLWGSPIRKTYPHAFELYPHACGGHIRTFDPATPVTAKWKNCVSTHTAATSM